MAVYFLDTSALVKRYALEDGTRWIQSVTDPAAGNLIYVGRITGAEVVAAIRRKVRNGETTETNARAVTEDFRFDFASQYQIIEINDVVVDRAMLLIENHKLRGYDGVQLAAAIEINDQLLAVGMPMTGVTALTMISADVDLNAAAAAEGLVVESPKSHPHPDDKTP